MISSRSGCDGGSLESAEAVVEAVVEALVEALVGA